METLSRVRWGNVGLALVVLVMAGVWVARPRSDVALPEDAPVAAAGPTPVVSPEAVEEPAVVVGPEAVEAPAVVAEPERVRRVDRRKRRRVRRRRVRPLRSAPAVRVVPAPRAAYVPPAPEFGFER